MVLSNNSLPPRALLTSTVRPEVGAEIPYAALYGFPVHSVHRVHSLPVKITVPKGEKEPPPPGSQTEGTVWESNFIPN